MDLDEVFADLSNIRLRVVRIDGVCCEIRCSRFVRFLGDGQPIGQERCDGWSRGQSRGCRIRLGKRLEIFAVDLTGVSSEVDADNLEVIGRGCGQTGEPSNVNGRWFFTQGATERGEGDVE